MQAQSPSDFLAVRTITLDSATSSTLVVVKNLGERRITGCAVLTGSRQYTQEFVYSVGMDSQVFRSRPAGFGGLEPAETMQLLFPPSGSGVPLTAHINAVIFEDRTAVGDEEQIASARSTAFCAQASAGQTAKTSSPLSAAALGSCGVVASEARTYAPECKPEFFTTASSSASSATITGVSYSYVPSVGCTAIESQSATTLVNVTAGVEVLAASDDCGVVVQSADITTDNIRVALSGSASASGSLVLYLTDNAGADRLITVLPSPPVGPGTYDRSFRLSSLANAEYVSVKAVWNPYGIALTGTRSYHFKVLGTLTHTVYNSPAETNCSGSDVPVKVFTSSCAVSSGQMKSGFVYRLQNPVGGTGSGHSILYKDVQNEAWCSGRDASSFRTDITIAGTMGPVSGSTVAVCPEDGELHQPGLRLYIAGLGVKTVTDNCPACCGRNRIDHYSTSTACSGLDSLPNAVTVLLY